MATATSNKRRVHATYIELVRKFPLRPIRSKRELDKAVGVIDSLVDRASLDEGEQDYLDVLGDLVTRYETKQFPIPPANDAEMLEHLIEAKGVTQARLARETGIAELTISEVRRGKRALSRQHIGKLAHFFSVSPAVFSFDD